MGENDLQKKMSMYQSQNKIQKIGEGNQAPKIIEAAPQLAYPSKSSILWAFYVFQ